MNALNKTHYHWLDLIRFFAAFLVLICHFRGAFFVDYSSLPLEQQNNIWIFMFYSITRLGTEAVLVFFVLSGFLVGGGTIKKLQNNTFKLKNYAIDRFVRIMLPLFSSLLLLIIIDLIFGNKIPWRPLIGNLLSLQGIVTYSVIDPLWSLAYEVWFYIFLGVLVYIFYNRNYCVKTFFAAILLVVVFGVFTKLNVHYLFIWIMGILAYLCMPSKFNTYILGISTMGLLSLIVILQLASGSKVYAMSLGFHKEIIEILFAFIFIIFMQQIILIIPQKKFFARLDKFGTVLASFSYTLYLTHVLVIQVLTYLGLPKSHSISLTSIGLYVLELCISLIAAYAVYWCFERHTFAVKSILKKYLLK